MHETQFVLFAPCFIVAAAFAGDAPSYEITHLPPIPSIFIESSTPRDINDDGIIVGDSINSALITHAVRWEDAQLEDIGGGGSMWSGAEGISPSGLITGWRRNELEQTGAALWIDGEAQFLGIPDGHFGGRGEAVNDSGIVVGWSVNAAVLDVAMMWVNGRMIQIGGLDSIAIDINNAGQVVYRQEGLERLAILWEAGRSTTLDHFGEGASPTSISQNGTISGAGLHPATSKFHAMLWTGESHDLVDLGLYLNFFPTAAHSVNDSGAAVGTATIEFVSGLTIAVLWQDGEAHDLNNLIPPDSGWTLRKATVINNHGVIVGHGELDGTSGPQGFVLTPIAQRLEGDFDDDGDVDFNDLLVLLNAWGRCGEDCIEDLNRSGDVGFADLLLLLANWS